MNMNGWYVYTTENEEKVVLIVTDNCILPRI
jgi:hypothetical protein